MADEVAKSSPFPEFYSLPIEEGRDFFSGLSAKEQVELFLWDLENWHPHTMYLSSMLVESGYVVIPYIAEELKRTGKFSAFKVWRLLDILTELSQQFPIGCDNQVIVVAQGAVNRLKKNPYEDEIAVRINKLVNECYKRSM